MNKYPLYFGLKKIAGEASTVSSFFLAIACRHFLIFYFELIIRNPLFELEVLFPWQNFTIPGTLSTNLDKLQALVVAKLKTPQEALSKITSDAALGDNLAKTKFAELTLLEAGEVTDPHVDEAKNLLEALKAHKEACNKALKKCMALV